MYLEIDEGFLGHRKTLKVCALLKDRQAATYMLRIWTWACRSCRDGNLRGMSAEDIEIAVSYRPGDGACYQAMATAGYIDEEDGKPATIHDWMEHTGKAIAKMEAKAEENRRRRADAKSRHATGKEQGGDVPESNRYRTGTIPSQTRPGTDQASDPGSLKGGSKKISLSTIREPRRHAVPLTPADREAIDANAIGEEPPLPH